ncbi:hypothetical protein mRhiFer1_010089 [Rhinolophus ferrumequinum]|uniref:Uncharacterized protein n=1 Tax=Rhinolophus ferrumequinum TaxID=59479 RepID=A0A7J7XPU0_RHIFE|nr:hypothetical protein mRhiFer1_010089 [Rhinolophus ferrumequinum]
MGSFQLVAAITRKERNRRGSVRVHDAQYSKYSFLKTLFPSHTCKQFTTCILHAAVMLVPCIAYPGPSQQALKATAFSFSLFCRASGPLFSEQERQCWAQDRSQDVLEDFRECPYPDDKAAGSARWWCHCVGSKNLGCGCLTEAWGQPEWGVPRPWPWA